ncbi:MAG TPA: dihydrofolate reductase [Verrucomicrobiales bacterium]|nr:dihydrofolate reductase [Verrucomicrobiales bacterium]
MIVTFIAAMSEDGIIAQNDRIPWHLPDEIAHFRRSCQGKWIMVGRRTWDQMDGWFKPGQTPVVVTRNPALTVPGGYSVSSVPAGLELAKNNGAPECMVIGGGEVFAAALPYADRMILTEVHVRLGTGTRFPEFDPGEWQITQTERHEPDAAHAFAYTIRVWQRR